MGARRRLGLWFSRGRRARGWGFAGSRGGAGSVRFAGLFRDHLTAWMMNHLKSPFLMKRCFISQRETR